MQHSNVIDLREWFGRDAYGIKTGSPASITSSAMEKTPPGTVTVSRRKNKRRSV